MNLYRVRRHPLRVTAHFRQSLVLTYALPASLLEALLPPGLTVDRYGDLGFVAIALVQTQGLRPEVLPRFLGQNFFLAGYRIFAHYTTREGRHLRGLRILRSYTDKRQMIWGGNLFTHYGYRLAQVHWDEAGDQMSLAVTTRDGEADLAAKINLAPDAPLPAGSPFPDFETAQQFAGPLPYTFDYERETHSMILVKGVRKKWDPQPVRAEVEKVTFFDHPPFRGTNPVLANAFRVADVPYAWEVGRVEALPAAVEVEQ